MCDGAAQRRLLLEMAGVVPTDTRRSQLLDQDANHVDEDDEVHLHADERRAAES